MTKEELAAMLNCREIGDEITKTESRLAAADGLVVVFGDPDDNVEFRGSIHDEVGCYDSTNYKLDITAHFGAHAEYSWTFETAIPHACFDILEDGRKFCRGIVFELASLL